jgi:hypothetical protein
VFICDLRVILHGSLDIPLQTIPAAVHLWKHHLPGVSICKPLLRTKREDPSLDLTRFEIGVSGATGVSSPDPDDGDDSFEQKDIGGTLFGTGD